MAEAFTGESAALYMRVMFDSANRVRPVNARAVARDALAAARSPRALTRLRLGLIHRHMPPPQPRSRCATRRVPRGNAPRARCRARGRPRRRRRHS